ncbi:MAG: hypothetical protein K940chlam8_00984 [Chlamydiae bacterium]|nr:hypothetical protein [Chlamydiota bacterium]
MTHRFLHNRHNWKLGTLIDRFLHNLDKKRGQSGKDLIEKWAAIVGQHIADFTQPLYVKNKIFYVAVKNASVYSLLNHYERKRLLQIIRKKFPHLGILQIVFKMG